MTGGPVGAVARAADAVTGYGGVAVLAGLGCAALLARRQGRAAILVGASAVGAIAGNAVLKALVARPRPDTVPAGVEVSDYSFPSGHAAGTAALATAVVLAATGRRRLAAALATAYVVLAGAAQLVLGLHRPSDVLGGWLWGAGWAALVGLGLRRTRDGGVEHHPP